MGIDYGVLPLQGLWWIETGEQVRMDNKDDWSWTAMIMQPEFITKDLIDEVIQQTISKKKVLPALSELRFDSLEEGECVQIMHVGPYAAEEPTIGHLHEFIAENGYKFNGKHHEIYISDARKAAPEKLKTIIRQPIKK